MPAQGRRTAGLRGGTAAAGVGRGRRPVHHHGEDHHPPAPGQARGPAGDRDRPRERLQDRRIVTRLRPPAMGRSRPHLPRRTARLRLTALYGGLFLACGAVLLAVTYVLVERAIDPAKLHLPSDRNPFADGADPFLAGQLQFLEGTLGKEIARTDLRQVLIQAPIALAIVTVIALILGWVVAGRVLRPLTTITAAARRISASSLHDRLARHGPADELKALGATLDA